jgi:hypothetical protein
VAAERVRALAQSQLGDHTAAAAGIASALALARSLAYDGLPLALLHEAQARIALAAGATAECAQAVISLHRLLEQAEAPALWNAYEALRGEGRAQLMAADPPAGSAGAGLPAMVTEIFTQLQTRFSALSERGERAQHALELLLEDCETDAGHLLLLDASGLFAAATRGSDGASEKLLADARRLLVLDADDVATVVVNVPPGEAGVSESTTRWLSDGEDSFAPLLLVDRADGHAQLSGVALLAVRAATPKAARPELVQAISRCLRDAGDSLAVAVDG